jgi:cation transport ATPase
MSTPHRIQSVFAVPKMDCPSEENIIKMALQGIDGVWSLSFDLGQRRMTALHSVPVVELLQRLEPLGLGATVVESASSSDSDDDDEIEAPDNASEARLLKLLLSINALMFVIEIVVGFWAQSAGLIADSLDMFADAAVYGLSLYAVGRSAALKTRAAHMAGWLQLGLALLALAEVVRRVVVGSEPVSGLMMGMGLVALIANLLGPHRQEEERRRAHEGELHLLVQRRHRQRRRDPRRRAGGADRLALSRSVHRLGGRTGCHERCSTHPAAQMNSLAYACFQRT